MNGKIIVIEGLDGCGKSTQLELLQKRFADCRFLTFPNYQSPSGEIITRYLQGGFPEESAERSAYAASSFYAIDRYTSFKEDWERDFKAGKTIISARYTTSNAFYQMTKLPRELWDGYCTWLYDYEYTKLGIPRPSAVIFLDVPVVVSQRLLSARYGGDEAKKDIHEADPAYLQTCRDAAMYACTHHAPEEHWHVLSCCEGETMRSVESIHEDIVALIMGETV